MPTVEEEFVTETGFEVGARVQITELVDYIGMVEFDEQRMAGCTGTVIEVDVDAEDVGDGESGPSMSIYVSAKVRLDDGREVHVNSSDEAVVVTDARETELIRKLLPAHGAVLSDDIVVSRVPGAPVAFRVSHPKVAKAYIANYTPGHLDRIIQLVRKEAKS